MRSRGEEKETSLDINYKCRKKIIVTQCMTTNEMNYKRKKYREKKIQLGVDIRIKPLGARIFVFKKFYNEIV